MRKSISDMWVEERRDAFETRLYEKSISDGMGEGAAFETRLYAIRVTM